MPKKEKAVNCPNCGAPIRSIPTFGVMAECDYCGSWVNVSDFILPKTPPKPVSVPAEKLDSPTSMSRHETVYIPEPVKQSNKKNPWTKDRVLGLIWLILTAIFIIFGDLFFISC